MTLIYNNNIEVQKLERESRFDMLSTYLPLIVTEAYCCIFAVSILLRLNPIMGSEGEMRELKGMIYSYLFMAVSDIIWAMQLSHIIRLENHLYAACNAVTLIAVAAGCYFCFQFFGEHLQMRYRNNKSIRRLTAIPMLLICVLDFISIFSGWIFYVGSDGQYMCGPGFWMQSIVAFSYLVSTLVCIFYKSWLVGFRAHRREYLSYILCMITAMATAFLEDYIPAVPLMPLHIYLVIQLLFLMLYVDRGQKYAQQENELMQSRMAIMLSQIQPHFLYNSLAVIQDLCHGKAPEAEQAVIEFSQFLRGNLDSLNRYEPIPFEEELEHTRNYLSLECRRFGSLLHVEYDIRVSGFRLPALSLQPIVENAVRYGIMQKENGGTVKISTEENDTDILITVTDDGVGYDVLEPKADGRTHIGISNVRKRIEMMCGGSLEIKSVPGVGTVAGITIPKRSI
jgi:two-component system LytT family sensor kinase